MNVPAMTAETNDAARRPTRSNVRWRRRATTCAGWPGAERGRAPSRGGARTICDRLDRPVPRGPAGLGGDAGAHRRDPAPATAGARSKRCGGSNAGSGCARSAGPRRRARARTRRVPAFVRTAPLGVNVAGYLDTESGMGEAARASIRSLEAAGIPVALNNVASRLRKQRRVLRRPPSSTTTRIPFNLVHLNADNMGWFADGRGKRYFRNPLHDRLLVLGAGGVSRRVGAVLRYVDEVWAASEFVREAFAAWSPVPVVRMPLPVVLPPCRRSAERTSASPTRGTVFLYIFDVSSQTERKNPLGAIHAFRRARFARDEAVLVLKFTNAEYDRAAVRALHEQADGLNVVFLDGYMDRAELCALLDARTATFAAPLRRVRPDDARSDGARQAGDRHRVLGQPRLHDADEQLSARLLAAAARSRLRSLHARRVVGRSGSRRSRAA